MKHRQFPLILFFFLIFSLFADLRGAGAQPAASEAVAEIAAATASTPTPDRKEAAASGPQSIHVGFYLLSGGKLEFVTSSIALDFYVWLSYTGSSSPQFEFLNSKNYKIEKLEEELPHPGTNVNYVCYRVNGTFDQDFDLKNYPFDRFQIKVFFEDTSKEADEVMYIPDERESGFDPMFHILGWHIRDFNLSTRVHLYNTNFGVPEKKRYESYSQVEFNVRVFRNHEIIFVKMVTPAILFLLIAILGVVLPIDQLSQKISLCVAALFSSVAYHLSLSQGLPPISYLTFADKMMIGNYCTIFTNLLFTTAIFLAGKHEYPDLQKCLTWISYIVVPGLALYIIRYLFIFGFYS